MGGPTPTSEDDEVIDLDAPAGEPASPPAEAAAGDPTPVTGDAPVEDAAAGQPAVSQGEYAPPPREPEPEPDGSRHPTWVAAESGTCPICTEEFGDQVSYRTHLADAHDLHDDEGTETELGRFEVEILPVAAATPALPDFLDSSRSRRPQEAPEMGRPIGLIVLVLFLFLMGAGVVAVTSGGSSDETAQEPEFRPWSNASSTTLAHAAPTTIPSAGTDSGPARAPEPSTSDAPAEPVQASPVVTAAPAPTTTAPAAVTPTTAAPAVFAAPKATKAKISSCERYKDTWVVTYRWTFSGGSLWRPLPAYTALGGGVYQHVLQVPRRTDTAITTVYVLDRLDRRHAVSLSPALTSASC